MWFRFDDKKCQSLKNKVFLNLTLNKLTRFNFQGSFYNF